MPGTRSLRNRAVLFDKSNCPSNSKNVPKGNYGKKENEEFIKLVPRVRYPAFKNKQLQESLTCDNICPLSTNGNLNQKHNALRSMSQGKENKTNPKRNTRQFCAFENALSKEHRVNSKKNISIVKNERITSNSSKISHKNVLSDTQRCTKRNTKTALVLENKKPVKKNIPIWKKNLNLSVMGSRKPVEERFPVWKKNLNLSKSKLGKKQQKGVDVYDIALDEEMCNEPAVKIKHTKRNIIKKKCSIISNPKQKKLIKNAVSTKSDDAMKKPSTLETTKCLLLPPVILHNPVNTSITNKIVRLDSSIESGINDVEIISEELMVEDVPTEAEGFIPCNFLSNFVNEFEKSLLVPKMTSTREDKVEAEFFVPRNSFLNFADEFEKSLLVPKMTSTPDDKGPSSHKNIAKLPDVSCISFINENDANKVTKTLKDSHKEKCAVNGNNISLFESPTKKKKVQKQGVIKFPALLPQINLFDENSKSASPKKLEESVLKPRKSYTPKNNFKVHLARTKRTQAVPQKKPAKSQQDVFIEKMMQHFDELIDTDLCIE